MRHTRLLPLAAAALVAAGCGDDQASEATDRGTTAAEQAREDLSPEAQAILDRSQDIVADLAETARLAAAGDIPQADVQQRLDRAAEEAASLADQARDLPESDAARERLTRLTADLERAADDLRADAQQGRFDESADVLAKLRESALDAYRALGEELTPDTRKQLEEAVRRLAGP